jgi:hypothetical protein
LIVAALKEMRHANQNRTRGKNGPQYQRPPCGLSVGHSQYLITVMGATSPHKPQIKASPITESGAKPKLQLQVLQ